MTELEKCLAGEYYDCHDEVFLKMKAKARRLLKEYHALAYGQKEEKREIRFGLRDTVFDPVRGFLINGTPLKFRGVCLHHDLGPLGAAVNRDATRHRAHRHHPYQNRNHAWPRAGYRPYRRHHPY